jgi:hypothetical protein
MKNWMPFALLLATAPALAQNAGPTEAELELASFVAESAGTDGVQVHWTTVSERPDVFFIVQRSKNALTWETATGTAGLGLQETTIYTVLDAHPFTDVTYYRLMAVENGLMSELSDVFAMEHRPVPSIHFRSEPTPGRFMVSSEGLITELKVLNDRGQFMPMELDIRVDEVLVNIELLPPGNYYVQALVNGTPVLRPVTFTSSGAIIGG